jgi:transposase, IS30 family
LTKKLRTGRPLRKRRRSPMARTPRFVAPGRLLHERPAVVEERARIVDWEGDLIVGRASRSAIGTLVDRRTGYLRLVHLPDGHSAEQLRVAMLPVLTDLPTLARQTLTWDQGSEMAYHHLLEEYFADGIFLRPAGQPVAARHEQEHQRTPPPVLPQGQRSAHLTLTDLRAVEQRINSRPRKRLAWRSPARAMETELAV